MSQSVEDDANDITGGDSIRLAGAGRFETAVAIADFAYDTLGFDETGVILARGDAFADALAAGPLGGVNEFPIVLTFPDRPAERHHRVLRGPRAAPWSTATSSAAPTPSAPPSRRRPRTPATTAPRRRPDADPDAERHRADRVTPDDTATLELTPGADDVHELTSAPTRSPAWSTGEEYRITRPRGLHGHRHRRRRRSSATPTTTTWPRPAPARPIIKSVNGAATQNNTGDGTALTAPPVTQTAVFVADADGTATFVLEGVERRVGPPRRLPQRWRRQRRRPTVAPAPASS